MCMSIPSQLSPARRRHFYRRAALAPLCLCLVAGWHLVRVWTCQQTPWKGGGFGMFSTVDDESARFVRCYSVTDSGKLPLPIPPAADKTIAELRAAPTQAKLDELARRLAEQDWRWQDERQLREVHAIREHAGVAISAAVFRSNSQHPRTDSAACSEHRLEPIPLGEHDENAVPFHEVQVECLRYRYDTAGQMLRAESMLSATAKREATP
jgi:hypothetical protein